MKSIFNCSNDMALAANVRQYVPPKRVKQMEEDLAHLSRWWEGTRFAGPWGWSMAAKQRYRLMGVDEGALPSDMWLDRVRCLSSRSFACRYLAELLREMNCGKLLGDNMRFVALEDVADIGIGGWLSREGYDDLYPLIFKLPWSSSGRGVFVAKDMCDGVSHRVSGMLSSQCGVAVDKFYEGKLLDFAMGSWNNMLWPMLVFRDTSKFTLQIGLNTLLTPYGNNYNLLIAGSMFGILPILIIYLIFQRYLIDGMTSGAVKG